MSTAATLKALFAADTTAPDYSETQPCFELHAALGWKPWWPSLSEVWKHEYPPEELAGTGQHRDWHLARIELMELYRQYSEAA